MEGVADEYWVHWSQIIDSTHSAGGTYVGTSISSKIVKKRAVCVGWRLTEMDRRCISWDILGATELSYKNFMGVIRIHAIFTSLCGGFEFQRSACFKWTHCWQLQTQKWSENNPFLLIFNWMEAASIILANYIYLEVSDWTWFASPYTVAVCFLAYVTVVQKVYANSSTAGFFLCHRISCQSHPVVHQKSGLNNTWKMLF